MALVGGKIQIRTIYHLRRYTKISTHADDILYNFIIDKKRKRNASSEDTSESKS